MCILDDTLMMYARPAETPVSLLHKSGCEIYHQVCESYIYVVVVCGGDRSNNLVASNCYCSRRRLPAITAAWIKKYYMEYFFLPTAALLRPLQQGMRLPQLYRSGWLSYLRSPTSMKSSPNLQTTMTINAVYAF